MIAAVGTRGDVAPYTGLGVALREAGHEVAIAAYQPFEDLVSACGIEFRGLPGDPRAAGSWTQSGQAGRAWSGPFEFPRLLRAIAAETRELLDGIHAAAQRGVDLMLLSMPAVLAIHVADGMRVPSMGVFLQPVFPTREFPPSVIAVGRSMGRWGNLAAGRLTIDMMGRLFNGLIKDIRADFGLPRLSARELRSRMENWPVLHGYSPSVLPRPADWRTELEVVGYWWPWRAKNWTPPDRLADFLDSGPAPVYVGFGSRNLDNSAELSALVLAALREAGVRGVIQAGWAELSVVADDVITIDEAPHDWLFPRMAAVAHHAGAGTAAAALRAGVPTIPMPVLADQPFWAARMSAMGVATPAIPLKRMSVDSLAAAIKAAVSNRAYRDNAVAASRAIAAEDGAARAIDAITRRHH
ncbi:glycosyltransferase [Kibdelosporangium aridum]|nr:glycosyltransferase [Kibdelosporangium aridum]